MPGMKNAPVHPYVIEETIRNARPFAFHTRKLSCYDFCIVALLISGKIHYIFDSGADFVLEPGETLLIPPGVPHCFESFSTGGNYHKLVLEFKGFALAEMFSRYGLNDFRIIREGFSEFKARISALRDRCNAPEKREQLMAIADAGAIMPPKSTWFEPKLRDGLVCHNF